ncbi:MAG: multiheme c-type cytochrome [Thermodesulfobacteriota bacterium]|nr:multiheme c-type cytochrome [Thermodesulfobacteriota bacterium]
MKRVLFGLVMSVLLMVGTAYAEEESCIVCHSKMTPGQVADWRVSAHAENDITCSVCHGESHVSAADVAKAAFPDEHVCQECHEQQFEQFTHGKHNFGWKSLNALPITHVEPDELMEGGRGCGGCHNMGIKTDEEKAAQLAAGQRYQNNSCDECHTRHSFSKKEAQDPRACQQCHMGYDHPQWEMWSSSKHGTRWFAREGGRLPEGAQAPTCQECHLPDGTHSNHTAWGFIGVRLPLPEDPQEKADKITILKALGVLNPETGKPTPRLALVQSVDMIRSTQEAFDLERNKMINTCKKCHSESYARAQLERGDSMLTKADMLLAKGIRIVAGLYKDGIIEKPADYVFAYPDFLYFLRTNGSQIDGMTHIDQVLFKMYMKHRMRTYQGQFHVNPDYAYWYGWAQMTNDLGEIEELAKFMRATHAKAH